MVYAATVAAAQALQEEEDLPAILLIPPLLLASVAQALLLAAQELLCETITSGRRTIGIEPEFVPYIHRTNVSCPPGESRGITTDI